MSLITYFFLIKQVFVLRYSKYQMMDIENCFCAHYTCFGNPTFTFPWDCKSNGKNIHKTAPNTRNMYLENCLIYCLRYELNVFFFCFFFFCFFFTQQIFMPIAYAFPFKGNRFVFYPQLANVAG